MRSLAAGLVVAAVKGSAPAWAAAGFWLATGAVVGVGVVGALVAPRLASSTDQQAPSLAPGGSRGNTSWPAPTGPNRAVTTEPIATPSAAVSVGGPPTAEPAASAPLVRGRRPVPPESGLSMGLARETSLVRAAQEAIVRGRASLALELLDEYEQRFPRGGLAVEAAAIRVLAICTQNPAEGRVLAEEFASKWPGSPLLARIGATCGVSR